MVVAKLKKELGSVASSSVQVDDGSGSAQGGDGGSSQGSYSGSSNISSSGQSSSSTGSTFIQEQVEQTTGQVSIDVEVSDVVEAGPAVSAFEVAEQQQEDTSQDMTFESGSDSFGGGDMDFSNRFDDALSTGQSIGQFLSNEAPDFGKFDVAPPSVQESRTTKAVESLADRLGKENAQEQLQAQFEANQVAGGFEDQTIAVAVVLAAMSGVMGGEIVMLGLVALPQLLRLGYDRKMSIGLICASGALATLIPPSIIMIIYGLSAQVAIGDLFMAGAVPGLLLAFLYALYVLARCNINPSMAPTAEEVAAARKKEMKMSKDKLYAVFLSIFLIFCVMGSIYGGIASVTEAAAVGVLGAIFVAAFRNSFDWNLLQVALAGTMSTVGTIIWLILGAVAFVGIYNLIGGADFMRSLFSGLGLPALGIVFVMMGILVVLGTFMEWIAIAFITVPVFAPVVVGMAPELGLEPEWAAVWFGVLFVMNIQIYFLSPPFGPACFWLKSVAPADIELQEIFYAVLPFIALQIIGMLMVMFIPVSYTHLTLPTKA